MNLDQSAYKQAYMKAIARLLAERCKTDRYLAEACNTTDKNLDMIFKYVESQAKKRATGNCAVLTDDEVLEMAVHFIMDGESETPKTEEPKDEPMKKPSKPSKAKSLAQEMADQLTFDF